jgi:hypothetical protein
MFPKLTGRVSGQYRVAFFADNRKLGDSPFTILEDPNGRANPKASVPRRALIVRASALEHPTLPSYEPRHALPQISVRALDERLLLIRNAPVYRNPGESSTAIRGVHSGKYIHVTGTVGPYLRVSLRDGTVGFLPSDAAITPPYSPQALAGNQVLATPVGVPSPAQSQQNIQNDAIEQQLMNRGVGIISSAINNIR